jgi:hypothetical protein
MKCNCTNALMFFGDGLIVGRLTDFDISCIVFTIIVGRKTQ